MRKTFLLITLLLMLGTWFTSCSTDVDLYADYKDIPVVYGLIDAKADTNYIKITRAFCSDNDHPLDANAAALVYDSSNYPGRLNAFIMEMKSTSGQPFLPTGRYIPLDTLTIHNKKPGAFYAPNQLLYYTDQQFNTNSEGEKYRYKLYVIKPDNDTVTAETGIVGGDISVGSSMVNFQARPSSVSQVMYFTASEEGLLYEIAMKFKYREIHEGQPMEQKEVSWTSGTKPLEAFEKVADQSYKHFYSVNALFKALDRAIGNDTVWDVNHPNVIRYMDDFVISISSAGEDFYNYYQYTMSTQYGLSLSSEYTNINGGCGLFSSRIQVERSVMLSSLALYDLFNKPWGFREE